VRANGFKDLEARVQAQEKTVNQFRLTLHGIQEKLNQIQTQHDLSTSIKLEDCRRRHQALAKRALSLAAKVQVLKNKGYALQPEEEALKKRLEGLARTVQDPATTGRMNEIWARMMVVQEKAKAMEESMGKVEIVWDEQQLQVTGKVRILSNWTTDGMCADSCNSCWKATSKVWTTLERRSSTSRSSFSSGRNSTRTVPVGCNDEAREGFEKLISHCGSHRVRSGAFGICSFRSTYIVHYPPICTPAR
jgi:hypothetical protein